MKLYHIILLTIIGYLMVGGSNDNENLLPKVKAIDSTKGLTKEYVDNNTYIDVDVENIVKGIVIPSSRSNNNDEDIAKMKGALYRFYSHTTIKNGFYECNLTDGSEINISQGVYLTLIYNLEAMNKCIKAAIDKGEKIELQVPDEKYLNSLLE